MNTSLLIIGIIIVLAVLVLSAILTWGIPFSNLLKIERENYWQRHNRSIPPEVKQQEDVDLSKTLHYFREDDDLEYISLLRESNTKFAEKNERLIKDYHRLENSILILQNTNNLLTKEILHIKGDVRYCLAHRTR
jgi:hypothetical protein